MHTVYLTAEEQKVFATLSDSIREGVTIQNEEFDTFESDKQLAMRYHLADFTLYPEVKQIAEAVLNGEDPSSFSLEDVPADVQKELYFTIGARGVDLLIRYVLREIEEAEDCAALCALTNARHELLSINSTAQHV